MSFITDPSALINGPDLPSGILVPDESLLPAVGTPVTLVLHFPTLAGPAADSAKVTP